MADLVADGMAWLADQQAAQVSRSVVYTDGTNQVTVAATIGSSLLRLDDEFEGTRIVRTERDFLIRAADLILGGVPAQPARGHLIRDTVGSVTHVYEVAAPGDEPEWRWADGHRVRYRIHAKRKGQE